MRRSPVALRVVSRRDLSATRPHTAADPDLDRVLDRLAATRPAMFRQLGRWARQLLAAAPKRVVSVALAVDVGEPESSPRSDLSERMARAEALLVEHERRISANERRLDGLDQRVAAGDRRFTDQDYELDMLSRISLRVARRIDRLEGRHEEEKAG